jgi:UDP-N-acetylglucosamine 1-carboxyvinyltransferase
MGYFIISGNTRLSGTIRPQGAKNEALQVLAATILTTKPVVISNIPNILDVNKMIALLSRLGVEVTNINEDTYTFSASHLDPQILEDPDCQQRFQELRGSVMLVGPLLARFGKVKIPAPGGDKIGRRRLDTHLIGLQKLGATVTYQKGVFEITAPQGLTGTYLLLDEASVTGTANLIMAAALARGTTTIYNAACEPYVQQLCKLLIQMGSEIQGVGSNLLTITGKDHLSGGTHRLLADMIEVGSFIGMAAMTQSELTIEAANVAQLGLIPDAFRRLGIQIMVQGDNLYIPAQEVCTIDTYIDGSILSLSDHTWPGLTPDLLSVLLVVATQCRGTVLIHQKMFESRLFFVDKLIDMGAQIILCDPHRATVIGLGRTQQLRAISMSSPDIRAGVALLIAALSADGTSKIYNIEQIDRGYERIDQRLNQLGASIVRVE